MCPYTQEIGTFRRPATSCTVRSSVWFSSPFFISVAPCFGKLRGHRALGRERPHELLGGLTAKKWGPPARFGVFFTVVFVEAVVASLELSIS